MPVGNELKLSWKGVTAIMKGMSITFRYLFHKPITVSFPEVKRELAPRFKGRHWLRLWPDGMERCVACLACMEVCPAGAILVVPGDNPPDKPVSKAKKYAVDFQFNFLRCIFDGACEEVCPTDALVLSKITDIGHYSREEFIYRKDRLNEPHPGASGYDPNWSRRPMPAAKPAVPVAAAATDTAVPKPAAAGAAVTPGVLAASSPVKSTPADAPAALKTTPTPSATPPSEKPHS